MYYYYLEGVGSKRFYSDGDGDYVTDKSKAALFRGLSDTHYNEIAPTPYFLVYATYHSGEPCYVSDTGALGYIQKNEPGVFKTKNKGEAIAVAMNALVYDNVKTVEIVVETL